MPRIKSHWYIRPLGVEVPPNNIDYSVLYFRNGDSSFILAINTKDVNEICQIAADLSNQTGFRWIRPTLTAQQHNEITLLSRNIALKDDSQSD